LKILFEYNIVFVSVHNHQEVSVYCANLPNEEESITFLPLMIAICCQEMVMIEFPEECANFGSDEPRLSNQMIDVLEDVRLTKVFCDYTNEQYKSLVTDKMVVVKPYRCVEQMTRDLLGTDSFSGGLSKVLEHSTGYKFERDSIAKNGWKNLNTADRIQKDGNFINFAAAEAFGIGLSYRGLLNNKQPGLRQPYVLARDQPETPPQVAAASINYEPPVIVHQSTDWSVFEGQSCKKNHSAANTTGTTKVRFREETHTEQHASYNPTDSELRTKYPRNLQQAGFRG
jgi:hypothetical protein